jgi:hypothetical protein
MSSRHAQPAARSSQPGTDGRAGSGAGPEPGRGLAGLA